MTSDVVCLLRGGGSGRTKSSKHAQDMKAKTQSRKYAPSGQRSSGAGDSRFESWAGQFFRLVTGAVFVLQAQFEDKIESRSLFVLIYLEQALAQSLACTNNSATGTRTRAARVRAEYPNQLDYSGLMSGAEKKHI